MLSGLLKTNGFKSLIAAQIISGLGDWLSIIAIMTMVGLKWNATPIEVSLIMLCLALPMVFLGPIAGAFADRFNRKLLMILSDLIRAGLILLLATADSILTVYICLLAIGTISTIFIPSKNGKLKELVDNHHIKSAISITTMIDSGTKILGPLLSGMLVSVLEVKTIFYLDSFSFLFSALLLLFLPKEKSRVTTVSTEIKKGIKPSFRKDLAIGIKFITSNTFMLTGMIFLGLSLLILQLADSQIIILIRELELASSNLFGYIVTASGTGMFLSGYILAKKTNYQPFISMLFGVCGIGISFGMMSLFTYFNVSHPNLWGSAFGFLGGFTATYVLVPYQAYIQAITPVQLTGRVFGVINSVTTTATIIGPLLGGWLSTILGVYITFLVSACLLILASIIGWVTRNRLDRGEKIDSKSQSKASGTATS